MFVNFGMYWIVKSFSYHPDILTNLSSADRPCEITFSRPSAEMICLVEVFEGVNLGTGKVGDDELGKNEICGARASSLKTKHENPALNLSSASPTCCRKRTDRFCLLILQRIFPRPWSKTGTRFLVTRGGTGKIWGLIAICLACLDPQCTWFPIVIFSLLSIAGLVLAIFTSLNVTTNQTRSVRHVICSIHQYFATFLLFVLTKKIQHWHCKWGARTSISFNQTPLSLLKPFRVFYFNRQWYVFPLLFCSVFLRSKTHFMVEWWGK